MIDEKFFDENLRFTVVWQVTVSKASNHKLLLLYCSSVEHEVKLAPLLPYKLEKVTPVAKCKNYSFNYLLLHTVKTIDWNWGTARSRHTSLDLNYSISDCSNFKTLIWKYPLFLFLFIKTLHKCWRPVGHQVLQPAKDVDLVGCFWAINSILSCQQNALT